MLFNQHTEFLSITLRLTRTYTRNVLQFLQCHRIGCCHCLQRRILEDYIRRNIQFFRHLLSQILQHGIKSRVDSTTSSSTNWSFILFFIEIRIFHNLERYRLLQELMSRWSHLQQTIILYILTQIACNKRLANNCIPCLFIFTFTGTKSFQFFMPVSKHFRSFLT